MRLARVRRSALLLVLAAAACRDLPTEAPTRRAPAPHAGRTELRCSVAVQARSMSCEPAGPRGVRANLIIGGQGLNVRLRTTNVTWNDSDNVLGADISVQNLLDQPLGTDGTSTYGVRVFFVSGPTVTQGTGSVDVLTDSVGIFTASNQKYFVWNEVIQPRGVSSPQLWEFSVDPTVIRFDFLVLVDTRTPAETSVLHFRPEHGSPVYFSGIYGVWAGSAHDVFAVSDGAVLHYDGNYWRAMDAGPCGCAPSLFAVWGSDGRDVYAVGAFGAVSHWTGETWMPMEDVDLGETDYYGIWGATAGDIWAVGSDATIVHYDGADWATQTVPAEVTGALYGVWGANVENVWAVGENGVVLHYDGAWAVDTTLAGTLNTVWGTSDSDIWAAGSGGLGGGVLYHYDGVEWSEVTDPVVTLTTLWSGWSSGATDVWIASGGDVLHWDGVSWTRTPIGSGAPLYGITGTAASDVFTVGDFGTIAHNGGGGWVTQALVDEDVLALWGSSPSDVWAAAGYTLLHRGATPAWTLQFTPDGAFLRGIWGASASQVWAVGDYGTVAYYNGADWSTVHVDSALTLNAAWGSSASDVWAAGDAGVLLRWNGTSWTTSIEGAGNHYAIWGSGTGDVFSAGTGGQILHWDGGAWTAMNTGTTDDLNGVWGSGPNDVYAVGDNGAVLHYDGNASLDWTLVTTPAAPGAPVTAIWGSGANDVFVLANYGVDLLHWDGSEWKTMTSFSFNAGVSLYALWGTGPRNLYAAGDVGSILHGQR